MRVFLFFVLLLPVFSAYAQPKDQKSSFISSTITMPDYYGKSTDSTLLFRLTSGVLAGVIPAFADSGLTVQLSASDVERIVSKKEYIDTFLFPHPESGDSMMMLTSREGSFFASRTFRMLVQTKPELKFLAFGIDRECSLPGFKSELGVPAPYKVKTTLLWLPYDKVRTLLAERDAVTNGKKFSEWIRDIIAEQYTSY